MLSGLLYSNIEHWNSISPETWRSFFISLLYFHLYSQPLWLYLLNISWIVLSFFLYAIAYFRLPSFFSLELDPSCSKRGHLKCKSVYGLCWPPKALQWITIVFRLKFNLFNIASKSVQALALANLLSLSYVTPYFNFSCVSHGLLTSCFFFTCSFYLKYFLPYHSFFLSLFKFLLILQFSV